MQTLCKTAGASGCGPTYWYGRINDSSKGAVGTVPTGHVRVWNLCVKNEQVLDKTAAAWSFTTRTTRSVASCYDSAMVLRAPHANEAAECAATRSGHLTAARVVSSPLIDCTRHPYT